VVASGRAAIGRGGSPSGPTLGLIAGGEPDATPESAPRNERRTPRRFVFSSHGNPMARASDRTEAALVTLIVVIWVLCLPVAAAGGSKLWADIAGTDRPQQQTYSTTNRAH